MTKQYKMIAMDMDDTLMTSQNEVSLETKAYLLKIQQEGYRVVLASGRPTAGMLPTAKLLQLDDYNSHIVSYNGGQITDVATEQTIVNHAVTKQDFDEIVDYCRAQGFFVLTYKDDCIIYDSEHEYMNIEAELTGLPMKKVDDIKAYIQTDVPKVMGVDYEENIGAACDAFNGQFNANIDVTTSKPYFLEFMAKNVSKGQALIELCSRFDMTIDEVIVFGDSSNDASMFEVAGKAIAMDNANDLLKSMAHEITLSNDENGIPHALKRILN